MLDMFQAGPVQSPKFGNQRKTGIRGVTTTNSKAYSVVCQEWEELWDGKRVRPNGISLHKDRPALGRYLDFYWKTSSGEDVPRPTGSGETLLVDEKTWATVQDNSMRIYSIHSGRAFARRVLKKPTVRANEGEESVEE